MSREFFHRPAEARPVPEQRICRGFQLLGWLVVGMTPILAGCSVSFPLSSMAPSGDNVTGSLAQVPFGQILDEEDRRREKAALATALDPQGDGATIHWENPKTKHKGSITPVGHAYAADSKICRAFLGDLEHDGGTRAMQGTACTVTAGEWAVKDAKPFKKA